MSNEIEKKNKPEIIQAYHEKEKQIFDLKAQTKNLEIELKDQTIKKVSANESVKRLERKLSKIENSVDAFLKIKFSKFLEKDKVVDRLTASSSYFDQDTIQQLAKDIESIDDENYLIMKHIKDIIKDM